MTGSAVERMKGHLESVGKRSVPASSEVGGPNLGGVDFERMTPSAREHFWFNLDRYALQLFHAADELSAAETRRHDAVVTAEHVCAAEVRRMLRVRRDDRGDFGLVFLLDAMQILGAALCGALATKVDFANQEGVLSFVAVVVVTIGVCVLREVTGGRRG